MGKLPTFLLSLKREAVCAVKAHEQALISSFVDTRTWEKHDYHVIWYCHLKATGNKPPRPETRVLSMRHVRRDGGLLATSYLNGQPTGIPVRALDLLDILIIIGTICAIAFVVLAVTACCKLHAYRSRTKNERRARRIRHGAAAPPPKDEADPEELAEEGEIKEKDGFPLRSMQGFAELGPDGQLQEINGHPRGVGSIDLADIDGRMRLELANGEIYEMDGGDWASLSPKMYCAEKHLMS